MGSSARLDTLINDPGESRRGIALIAHPHPLFGGTNENKVVQTLAKTFYQLGCVAIRPNFRGVGMSAGSHATKEWRRGRRLCAYG
jgi:alpha/beta superfamily hydrolase